MTHQHNIPGQNNDKTHGQEPLTDLIALCTSGNRAAQKRLYDTYAPATYGIVKRYIYDDRKAQEILNDTFFKVFTKIQTYAFGGAFEGWIRRIAINVITDHLRQNIKHERAIQHNLEHIDPYVDETLVSKLSYKELLLLIHELPDTQKTVFNLNVFESLSHKEIGEHLGITENNSRWYLNDARKRLKEKIKTKM